MSPSMQQLSSPATSWLWPITPAAYDHTPVLSGSERAELERIFSQPRGQIRPPSRCILERLVRPIEDVLRSLHAPRDDSLAVIRILCIEMHQRGTTFWAWSLETWLDILGPNITLFSQRYRCTDLKHAARAYLPLVVYLLDAIPDVWPLIERIELHTQAQKIFGKAAIEQAVLRLRTVLQSWGYRQKEQEGFVACISYLFLRNRSPALEHLTDELLELVDHTCTLPCVQTYLFQVSRALCGLGVIARPFPEMRRERHALSDTDRSLSAEWLSWCQRWRKQSTLRDATHSYYPLLKVGRWLHVHHPEVTTPLQWTYELAAEFVAAVCTMKVGEWSDARQRQYLGAERVGQPLRPNSQARLLKSLRVFLSDCQEWGWIPIRINPHRALRTPRSLQNQIGPNPRVVDKEAWAKLLWAAMNLQEEDLPQANGRLMYPLEMVRAVAVVWCFVVLCGAALR